MEQGRVHIIGKSSTWVNCNISRTRNKTIWGIHQWFRRFGRSEGEQWDRYNFPRPNGKLYSILCLSSVHTLYELGKEVILLRFYSVHPTDFVPNILWENPWKKKQWTTLSLRAIGNNFDIFSWYPVDSTVPEFNPSNESLACSKLSLEYGEYGLSEGRNMLMIFTVTGSTMGIGS